MKRWYLYCIRLPINDYAVSYIGVSHKPRRRFVEHHSSPTLIGRTLKACGYKNAVLEIWVAGDRDYMYALETAAIAKFGTRFPNGCNLSSGGYGSRDWLPETRKKLAAAKRGRPSPKSGETRRRMSLAALGNRKGAANKGRQITWRHKIARTLIGNRNKVGKTKVPYVK